MTYTTKNFRFIDGIFYRYLYSQSVDKKLADMITYWNNPSKKLSSEICDLSVKIYRWIYWQTKHVKINFTCFILSVFLSLNITYQQKKNACQRDHLLYEYIILLLTSFIIILMTFFYFLIVIWWHRKHIFLLKNKLLFLDHWSVFTLNSVFFPSHIIIYVLFLK